MKTPTNRVIDDYLRRLDRALRGLPRSRRRELVEEIQAHIADARAEAGGLSEADARTLLDRLGDPEDIAAEARAGVPVRGRPAGFEVAAVILVLAGGFVFGVGWLAGVVMLWTSDVWRLREKLIGTFVVPGGLAGGLYFGFFNLISSAEICTISTDAAGRTHEVCSGDPTTTLDAVLTLTGLVLGLVLPFVTAWWLLRRARRAAPAPATAAYA